MKISDEIKKAVQQHVMTYVDKVSGQINQLGNDINKADGSVGGLPALLDGLTALSATQSTLEAQIEAREILIVGKRRLH